MASDEHELVERFTHARTGTAEAVLEGFHAVKHAIRFDASIHEVVVLEDTHPDELPPELHAAGAARREVTEAVFDRIVTRRPPVPIVARAARPPVDTAALLRTEGRRTGSLTGDAGNTTDRARAPVVLLEHPTHAGNLGAAVRVAAAAGAAGLVAVGSLDPWSPAALRGGAGLQYALPVGRLDDLSALVDGPRPIVAFDPDGLDLRDVTAPVGAVLAFGTERSGISDELRRAADHLVSIPMRPQVSSLNLATAVAVALYAFTGPSVDV